MQTQGCRIKTLLANLALLQFRCSLHRKLLITPFLVNVLSRLNTTWLRNYWRGAFSTTRRVVKLTSTWDLLWRRNNLTKMQQWNMKRHGNTAIKTTQTSVSNYLFDERVTHTDTSMLRKSEKERENWKVFFLSIISVKRQPYYLSRFVYAHRFLARTCYYHR